MRFFTKRKAKLLFGFAVVLSLLILNGILYYNEARVKTDLIVVIDAGHGGNDPGKIGADDSKEKDINLQIAMSLKAQLVARGVTVVMTREEDVCLAQDGARNKKVSDMHARVSIINETGADMMISIHQNSYPSEDVSGPQVFYYSPSEASEQLAQNIQAQMIRDLKPEKQREIKSGDDLYILRNSDCPAVIVECGFLSNPTECQKLKDPAYQNKVAQAIARAVTEMTDK